MSDQNDKSGSNDQDDIDALLESALGDISSDTENNADSAMDFDIDDILQAAGIEESAEGDTDASAGDFNIDDILSAAEQPADTGTADAGADFDIDDILNTTTEAITKPGGEKKVAAQGDDLDIDALIDDATGDVTAPAPDGETMAASTPGTPPPEDSTAGMDILSGGTLPTLASADVPNATPPAETQATAQDDIDSLFEASATADESTAISSHLAGEELDIDDIMADMGLVDDALMATDSDNLHAEPSAADDALTAVTGELADVTPGHDVLTDIEANPENARPDEGQAETAAEEAAMEAKAGPDTGTDIVFVDDVSVDAMPVDAGPVEEMPAVESPPAGDTLENNDNKDGLETLDINLALGDIATGATTETRSSEVMEEAVQEEVTLDEAKPEAAAEPTVEIPTLTDVAMTGEAYRATLSGQPTDGDMHTLLGEAASQAVHQALQEAAPAIEKAVLEQLQDRLPSLIQRAMQNQANRGA